MENLQRFLDVLLGISKSLKAKIIGGSIVGVVIAAVIAAIVFVGPIDVAKPKVEDEFKNWNRSGPFAISKFEYMIGDNVFIAVDGLQPTDIGNLVFVMPNGTTKYITIPFNGNEKSGFNQYFKPAISKGRGICSIDDLIGEWTVVFQQTKYQPLKFRIINETVPGDAGIFQRVC